MIKLLVIIAIFASWPSKTVVAQFGQPEVRGNVATSPADDKRPTQPVQPKTPIVQPKRQPQSQPSPPSRPAPPPAIPVSESAKSQDQRDYESLVQKRIEDLAAQISSLERETPGLNELAKRNFRDALNTAAGNRSVVRTKIKQLKFVPPAQWNTLKAGIEKAFVNLEQSIRVARSYVESENQDAE